MRLHVCWYIICQSPLCSHIYVKGCWAWHHPMVAPIHSQPLSCLLIHGQGVLSIGWRWQRKMTRLVITHRILNTSNICSHNSSRIQASTDKERRGTREFLQRLGKTWYQLDIQIRFLFIFCLATLNQKSFKIGSPARCSVLWCKSKIIANARFRFGWFTVAAASTPRFS